MKAIDGRGLKSFGPSQNPRILKSPKPRVILYKACKLGSRETSTGFLLAIYGPLQVWGIVSDLRILKIRFVAKLANWYGLRAILGKSLKSLNPSDQRAI